MQQLSPDQKLSLSHILEWFKKDKQDMQFVSLGGYAGTGKTTLIAFLRKELHKLHADLHVGFASYTGKAARVLQTKLKEEKAVLKGDTVGTIHSLIYTPVVNDREIIIGWKQKEKLECDLIIIDEASMVDGTIWEHLVSYHKPIIVVGDHGQLPPVKGNFNLMAKPDVVLTEIHRQAHLNPIIEVSIQARETGEIQSKKYSDTVIKFSRDDPETGERMTELLNAYSTDTLILCGYNSTRKRLNNYIRSSLGIETPDPVVGDRVICLRNNHKAEIYNGMLGTIQSIQRNDNDWYAADIDMDGSEVQYSGLISVAQFNADTAMNFTENRRLIMQGDLFDFGYALTVHKAQGSQAKRVILFEERFKKMDDDQWRRWLYTAVTRAESELYIFPS
jgi:exodeoxyribonuclease-5